MNATPSTEVQQTTTTPRVPTSLASTSFKSNPKIQSRVIKGELSSAVKKGLLTELTAKILYSKLTKGDPSDIGKKTPQGRIEAEDIRWLINRSHALQKEGVLDVKQRIFLLVSHYGGGFALAEKNIKNGFIKSNQFYQTFHKGHIWQGYGDKGFVNDFLTFLKPALQELEKVGTQLSNLFTPPLQPISPPKTPITKYSPIKLLSDPLSYIKARPQRKEFILWPNRPTVLIIPGHGGRDPGAVANGVTEESLARKQSLFVAEYLLSLGVNVVILRRRADEGVSINARNRIIQTQENGKRKYTVAVSIHFNSARSSRANGIEVFYKDSGDKKLAEYVNRSWKDKGNMLNRGVKHDSLTGVGGLGIMRNNPVPVVLTEGGFMSNSSADFKKITNDKFLQEQGHGIGAGIFNYLRSQGKLN
jgi:N-acetylmuramoyl-L-alanine amidase